MDFKSRCGRQLDYNHNYINFTEIRKTSQPQPSSVDFFVECVDTVTKFFSVLLLVLGYVCNPISVAVLSRKTFRNSTMSVYLRFVAMCDTVTLTTGLVTMFRLSLIGRDILRDLNICRLYYWVLCVSSECSSWTLLAVTLERTISIARPHKVKDVCSVATSKVAVVLIFLFWSSILIFVPFMLGHQTWTDPVTNFTQTRICILANGIPLTLVLKNVLDIAAYAIIPSAVLIVCNVIIVMSVIQSRKRVYKISKGCKNHKEVTSSASRYINNSEFKSTKNKSTKNGRSYKETSMTFTLVCINTSYIACNLPVVVYQLIRSLRAEVNVTVRDNAVFMLLFLVIYFNSVLNFLFYFLTGSRFRQELTNMLIEMVHCLKAKGV